MADLDPIPLRKLPRNVVVLVGSTGSGKSTLGSFLVAPLSFEEHPPFVRASSLAPTTDHAQRASFSFHGSQFDVYDTAGLNEGNEADDRHMLELLQALRANGSLTCVILCIKLDAKFDKQFYSTLKFFSSLFQSCQGSNLLVVVTNTAMDNASIRRRERDKFNLNAVLADMAQRVADITGVKHPPPVIPIDARPFIDDLDFTEYDIAKKTREQMLRLVMSMPRVSTESMLFAKTPSMKEQDDALISALHGKLEGFKTAFHQFSSLQAAAVASIGETIESIEALKKEDLDIKRQILFKQSDEEENVYTKSETLSWSLIDAWRTFTYDVIVETPISRVEATVPPESAQWIESGYHGMHAWGTAQGHFWRGFTVNVIIYSRKRDIYAKELLAFSNRRKEIAEKHSLLDRLQQSLGARNSDYEADINKLQTFIKDISAQIAELQSTHLTIDEAVKRLRARQP